MKNSKAQTKVAEKMFQCPVCLRAGFFARGLKTHCCPELAPLPDGGRSRLPAEIIWALFDGKTGNELAGIVASARAAHSTKLNEETQP